MKIFTYFLNYTNFWIRCKELEKIKKAGIPEDEDLDTSAASELPGLVDYWSSQLTGNPNVLKYIRDRLYPEYVL